MVICKETWSWASRIGETSESESEWKSSHISKERTDLLLMSNVPQVKFHTMRRTTEIQSKMYVWNSSNPNILEQTLPRNEWTFFLFRAHVRLRRTCSSLCQFCCHLCFLVSMAQSEHVVFRTPPSHFTNSHYRKQQMLAGTNPKIGSHNNTTITHQQMHQSWFFGIAYIIWKAGSCRNQTDSQQRHYCIKRQIPRTNIAGVGLIKQKQQCSLIP